MTIAEAINESTRTNTIVHVHVTYLSDAMSALAGSYDYDSADEDDTEDGLRAIGVWDANQDDEAMGWRLLVTYDSDEVSR
jgi:hypothetical protein